MRCPPLPPPFVLMRSGRLMASATRILAPSMSRPSHFMATSRMLSPWPGLQVQKAFAFLASHRQFSPSLPCSGYGHRMWFDLVQRRQSMLRASSTSVSRPWTAALMSRVTT